MNKFDCEDGRIVILAETMPDESELTLLTEPILSGKVQAVFGLGSGKPGRVDRLLTLASNILTGMRLSSMTHLCYAFKKEAYEKLTLTEKGAGVTAELAAKLADRKLSAAEVKLSAPRKHYANLLHALISVIIHCPLITYGAVGFISTIIEWVIFWLLDNLTPVTVALSTAIAFTISTVANWFLGRAWTFKAHAGNYSDIVPVILVSIVGLGLSELLMWGFTAGLGFPNFLSKVIVTMLVFFWNYLARKKLVYSHK